MGLIFFLLCEDSTVLSSSFTFTLTFNEYLLTTRYFFECYWEAVVLDSSCLYNKAHKIHMGTCETLADEEKNEHLE